MRGGLIGTIVAAVALVATAGPAAAIPIPGGTALTGSPPPEFIDGGPYEPRPVKAPRVPRHPFMAKNGRSVIHNDAYQTDTYTGAGPLGREIVSTSTYQFADCASPTFPRSGVIVVTCVGLQGPRLMMFNPVTLEEIDIYNLPLRRIGNLSFFTDFSGGGYFYLDNKDRAVLPTTDGRVLIVGTSGGRFGLESQYRVKPELEGNEGINSALPDWDGNIWFVGTTGSVGAIDPESGSVQSVDLDEDIENSFSVDETGGVYVVTDRALYRLEAGRGGKPRISWRQRYPNDRVQKPGQTDDASGTTPTLMGKKYVSITDNDDPIAINVYRREENFKGRRLVCRQPVFEKGRGSTDQSLIATGRSMIAENNYGYTGPVDGLDTVPGIERVDIDKDGRGCHKVWKSDVQAPSVVPKLSLKNGLVYTYTLEPQGSDNWYLTALDFRTGRRVYSAFAGSGLGFNNNYAPVILGPDGTAYVGVLGGLVALRDTR
jgi:hypothetical protein